MGPDLAYHVTPGCNLSGIMSKGVRPGSFWWASRELAKAFCEEIAKEGEDPVTFSARISDISSVAGRNGLTPDRDMLFSPFPDIILKSPDQIMAEWADSDGRWRDSARIVGSFVCEVTVPPMFLILETENPAPQVEEEPSGPSL